MEEGQELGGVDGVTWGEAGRPPGAPCSGGPQQDAPSTQEGEEKRAIAIELWGEDR